METLLVSEHKNQYYNRVKQHGPGRFGPSPSKSFRGINCRTFQSGSGILPTPKQRSNHSTYSPKTPPTPSSSDSHFDTTPKSKSYSDNKPLSRNTGKTTPINIITKSSKKEKHFKNDKSFSFSELWAGPAYSNSPPPSSLPIPSFSARPKRTVSLELPRAVSADDIEVHPIAKSAPPSPTREYSSSKRDLFHNADSATRTLRRILNLDVDDE